MNTCVIATPIGRLRITEENDVLTSITMTDSALIEPESVLLHVAVQQLEAYFSGELQVFQLPLAPARTPFQQAIRAGMLSVPYGEAISYAELAARAGSPRALRAAGQACHTNPFMIVVPCHRIVASNGKEGGYAFGLDAKRFLLQLEQNNTL